MRAYGTPRSREPLFEEPCWCTGNPVAGTLSHALSHYTIRVPGPTRTLLRQRLHDAGICTTTLWRFPTWLEPDQFPNAHRLSLEGRQPALCPVTLSLSDVDRICDFATPFHRLEFLREITGRTGRCSGLARIFVQLRYGGCPVEIQNVGECWRLPLPAFPFRNAATGVWISIGSEIRSQKR